MSWGKIIPPLSGLLAAGPVPEFIPLVPHRFETKFEATIEIKFCTNQEESVRTRIALSILALILTVSAFADQITLKNGDRLTGSITKSDGKELVVKTDYAGDVTVKFDSVFSVPGVKLTKS